LVWKEYVKKLFFVLLAAIILDCMFNHSHASEITAKSWVVVENGHVLQGKNTTEVRSIGSITKLVTAMVYLDVHGSITSKTDQDLFQRMIVSSDNRASKILCSKIPDCILLMNLKAKEMGLVNTRFTEPSGLSVFNSSNTEELVKIVEAASAYPEIVNASRTVKGNTNPTIGKYDYSVSKTGYIHLAGGCIVAKVKNRIVVILGSKNVKTRIPELEKLITLRNPVS
jgi:D-alanyl-D-alanine endopeptidase (penicillin-binding protein 7)